MSSPRPIRSSDAKIPKELKGDRPILDEAAKRALQPFATALRGFLGPNGSLTLQGAGTQLRGIPVFAEAMEEQRITGVGALQHFLDLFPEFVVEVASPQGICATRLEGARTFCGNVTLAQNLHVRGVHHEAECRSHDPEVAYVESQLETCARPLRSLCAHNPQHPSSGMRMAPLC